MMIAAQIGPIPTMSVRVVPEAETAVAIRRLDAASASSSRVMSPTSSGDEDPIPGHFVIAHNAFDQPVCLAHTDQRGDTTRMELEKQRVETAGMFRPQSGHVPMAFHQQTQHPGVIIRPDCCQTV